MQIGRKSKVEVEIETDCLGLFTVQGSGLPTFLVGESEIRGGQESARQRICCCLEKERACPANARTDHHQSRQAKPRLSFFDNSTLALGIKQHLLAFSLSLRIWPLKDFTLAYPCQLALSSSCVQFGPHSKAQRVSPVHARLLEPPLTVIDLLLP